MSEPLEQRDIPELVGEASLKENRVVEWFDSLKAKDPVWARAFGLYATYGIRPGELWTLDTSRLNDNNYHELVVRANKTNRTRVTYPYPVEWFDRVYLHWMDERHHRKLFDRLVDK
jgi:integrase